LDVPSSTTGGCGAGCPDGDDARPPSPWLEAPPSAVVVGVLDQTNAKGKGRAGRRTDCLGQVDLWIVGGEGNGRD
jgi:hypothetical protein